MIIWHAVRVLVRARLLIARNTFLERKWWQKISLVLVFLIAAGFAVGIFFISSATVQSINSPEFAALLQEAAQMEEDIPPLAPDELLRVAPSFGLFAASLLLVFSSFGSVLSSLYLSGDMDMLLSKPVPMRAVFVVKFFSGLLAQYALLFVLLGPVLLGYGSGLGYGWLYMVVAVGVVLLLPLLPIGIGALLVMAVVRVIPAYRAREIVSILGGLVAVTFYILSQFAPEVAPLIADVQNVQALLQLDIPLLPSAWAGRALIAAGEGEILTLLAYGGLFLILSILVFAGCLLLAERLYYVGWSNMAIQGGKVRRSRQRAAHDTATPKHRLPFPALVRQWAALEPQSAAVFLKDWRIFPRDMRNIQQFIFPLALAGIWIFRLLTMPQESAQTAGTDLIDTDMLVGLSSTGITFFLCYTLSSAIAGPGISRESRTLWLLKLAPISTLRILLGKLVLAYLPYIVFGTPALVLLSVLSQASLPDFLIGWGLLLLLGLGSTAISLGLGAAFPRLDWDNPQQQTTLLAGCLGLLLLPLYIGLILLAIFGVAAIPDLLVLVGLLTHESAISILFDALSWLLALMMTALTVGASITAGTYGLERVEL